MSKKSKALLAIVAAGLLVTAGWVGYKNFFITKPEEVKSLGTMKIGLSLWPGFLPLAVAKDRGYFDELGLNVELKNYVSLADLGKEYKEGRLDARANITLETINESLAGVNHKIVLATDYSNGADAIMAKQGIKKVADFKNKKVAVEKGTMEEFFLSWALIENGFKKSDVIIIDSNPEDAAKLLAEGKVDVAVTYEPYIFTILGGKKFSRVYTSHDAPGLITSLITIKTDYIKSHPEAVQALVKGYFMGYKFWEENPTKAAEIYAKIYGIPGSEIEAALTEIKLFNIRDEKTAFTFAPGLQSLYGNLHKTAEFLLVENPSLSKTINTSILVDPAFVRGL